MKHSKDALRRWQWIASALLAVLLCSACATDTVPSLPPPSIKPAVPPPLPAEALQVLPDPTLCSPSCGEQQRKRWSLLGGSTAPSTAASGASGSTTPSDSKP